jgi:hypothetical protein
VALYQAQTVARPVQGDLAQPATRAYSAGTLEELRAELATQASPPTPAGSRTRARRTWLALAVVASVACAAAAGALLGRRAPAGATAGDPPPRGASAAAITPVSPPARSASGPARAAVPARAPAARAEIAAGATAHPAASRGPLPSPRAAAEWLARGRYRRALDAYRALSQASPGRPVFAHVAEALARKLTRRCERRAAEGDVACLDDHP